jgi:chromosome partitioning protein
MNAKGGCGKTTVAINLASYCAAKGVGAALFDYDPQASSTFWLRSRPPELPGIHGVAAYQPPQQGVTRAWQLRVPDRTEFVITDTPAGYTGLDIEDRVAESDVILIPVLPSAIDIHSTADFIRDVLLIGKARARNKQLAIVVNRARLRTKALEKLERFVNNLDIPVIGQIRDTQLYVHAVEQGVGVHELGDRAAEQDAACWAQIFSWLQGQQRTSVPPPGPLPYAMPSACTR